MGFTSVTLQRKKPDQVNFRLMAAFAAAVILV